MAEQRTTAFTLAEFGWGRRHRWRSSRHAPYHHGRADAAESGGRWPVRVRQHCLSTGQHPASEISRWTFFALSSWGRPSAQERRPTRGSIGVGNTDQSRATGQVCMPQRCTVLRSIRRRRRSRPEGRNDTVSSPAKHSGCRAGSYAEMYQPSPPSPPLAPNTNSAAINVPRKSPAILRPVRSGKGPGIECARCSPLC